MWYRTWYNYSPPWPRYLWSSANSPHPFQNQDKHLKVRHNYSPPLPKNWLGFQIWSFSDSERARELEFQKEKFCPGWTIITSCPINFGVKLCIFVQFHLKQPGILVFSIQNSEIGDLIFELYIFWIVYLSETFMFRLR